MVPKISALAYEQQFDPARDLPHYAAYPNTYLIASTPRCGSHFLGHALAETGLFGVPLEYLHKGNLIGWRRRFGQISHREILEQIVKKRTSPNGSFGIKAHWSQFHPAAHDDTLEAILPIGKVVFIWRRDLLAQAISYLKAHQTGQWISSAPKRREPEFRYRKLVQFAADIRQQNQSWSAWLAQSGIPVHHVVYEQLLEDGEGELKKITKFLNADVETYARPSSRTQRQADGTSAEWRSKFKSSRRHVHRWIEESQDWSNPAPER